MRVPEGTEQQLRTMVDRLPPWLREHVQRVELEAVRLAQLHGVDCGRARLAALGHDLVRHKRDAELLQLAAEFSIRPDRVETASPLLIHGPIAAHILRHDLSLDDADVLAAVSFHTTARAGMSTLERVLFVADKVEPMKRRRSAELAEVYDLAASDLAAASLRYLDYNLEQAARRGWFLHYRTLEARNELLAARSLLRRDLRDG